MFPVIAGGQGLAKLYLQFFSGVVAFMIRYD